jgi:hypothetical protein
MDIADRECSLLPQKAIFDIECTLKISLGGHPITPEAFSSARSAARKPKLLSTSSLSAPGAEGAGRAHPGVREKRGAGAGWRTLRAVS